MNNYYITLVMIVIDYITNCLSQLDRDNISDYVKHQLHTMDKNDTTMYSPFAKEISCCHSQSQNHSIWHICPLFSNIVPIAYPMILKLHLKHSLECCLLSVGRWIFSLIYRSKCILQFRAASVYTCVGGVLL
jgi:hypothetical protein